MCIKILPLSIKKKKKKNEVKKYIYLFIFFVNFETLCKKKCHYHNSVCFSPLAEADFN